jgi:multiple sugar transport system substrate-binding protein
MVNYPFVYASAKANAPDVFKHMRAAKLPRVVAGRPSEPPIGGINLGISRFSKHKALAFDAAACLSRPANQLTVTEKEGLPPVRSGLFDRSQVRKAYPGFAELIRRSIRDAAPRPSQSPAYQDLSLAIQRAVHPTDDIDPDDPSPTYDDLRDKVQHAIDRDGLL